MRVLTSKIQCVGFCIEGSPKAMPKKSATTGKKGCAPCDTFSTGLMKCPIRLNLDEVLSDLGCRYSVQSVNDYYRANPPSAADIARCNPTPGHPSQSQSKKPKKAAIKKPKQGSKRSRKA